MTHRCLLYSTVIVFSTLVLALCAMPTMAQIGSVGTLGDSITDLENPPNVTDYYPWSRWAAEVGGVNFGPWSNWPDFRTSDYQYNYAHGGATTSSMISEGQHTLLASENVDVASYLNGANDLAYYLQNSLFYNDKIHPGKVMTGLMSNMFTKALNLKYGCSYPLLSDQTILTAAGYSPAPGETYYNIDPYIDLHTPSGLMAAAVPEPASMSLLLVAFIVGLGMGLVRKRGY